MNRIINSHVHDHKVSPSKKGAIFVFCPADIYLDHESSMALLIRKSINAFADENREDSGVYFNAWTVEKSNLLPAISSIPRHFSLGQDCSVHICFMGHGSPGNLVWDQGSTISAREILDHIKDMYFSDLESVSFLGCNTLAGVDLSYLPFDVVGFKDFVYWNEVPIFLSRMFKEYFQGESMKNSVSMARKSCSVSNLTKFPKHSIVFRSASRRFQHIKK